MHNVIGNSCLWCVYEDVKPSASSSAFMEIADVVNKHLQSSAYLEITDIVNKHLRYIPIPAYVFHPLILFIICR